MTKFKATYYDIEHGVEVCTVLTVETSYTSDDEWSRALTKALQNKADYMSLVQLEMICD